MRFYVLEITDRADTHPRVWGPYQTSPARDFRARQLHMAGPEHLFLRANINESFGLDIMAFSEELWDLPTTDTELFMFKTK